MTSHVDQGEVASFDRSVAEMKKSDGNSSIRDASSDADASSCTAMQQLQADWGRFETVFARGLYR